MDQKASILIVDDHESTCRTLNLILSKEGFETETIGTGQGAIEKASKRFYNVALLDIKLPDMEGVDVLAVLREMHPDMMIVMITAYASVESAVRALNQGASAYVTKPLNVDEVLATLRQLCEKQRLVIENRRLYQEAQRELANRKRAEEALKRSNRKLLIEHKQRKLLSKRLITLLEDCRRKIAMELHDQLGQTLTVVKMDLEMILSQLKPADAALKDSMQVAKDKAIQAIEDIQNIAHGLRPSLLDTLGLVPALRALFKGIEQHNDVEIHFSPLYISERLSPEKELAIYRIAQEALTNVVKHARTKNVFVNLASEDRFITFGVEDEGVGFDQSEVMKISKGKGPLGLLTMQERAVQLGGEFSIDSRIDRGTHLLVRIPM